MESNTYWRKKKKKKDDDSCMYDHVNWFYGDFRALI